MIETEIPVYIMLEAMPPQNCFIKGAKKLKLAQPVPLNILPRQLPIW